MKNDGELVGAGHRKGDRVEYSNDHFRHGWEHDAVVVGSDKHGRIGIRLVNGPLEGRRMYVSPNNLQRVAQRRLFVNVTTEDGELLERIAVELQTKESPLGSERWGVIAAVESAAHIVFAREEASTGVTSSS